MFAVVICLSALVGAVVAQKAKEPAMVVALADGITWGAAPPVFEKGATFAVMSGDPAKAGPYVIRLRMPAGYRINPHWHPTDEHVTVVSGTFAAGMGETFDIAAMKTLPVASYVMVPSEMRHYALARTAVVVQVHGMGPFVLTYVNPADDPSQRSTQ